MRRQWARASAFRRTMTAGSGGGTPAPTLQLADGGWTWYNDPRAIVTGDTVFFGSISGTASGGDARISQLGGSTSTLNENMEVDDHDNVALLELPGGKIVGFYCKHTDISGLRYRVTSSPRDISAFATEVVVGNSGVEVSYAKPFLFSDGYIRLFQRSSVTTTRPYHMVKALASGVAAGSPTWTRTSVLQTTNARPYGILRQNGDRVDFLVTNGHPNEVVTRLYHVYMNLVGGAEKWYKSDGTEIVSGLPIDVETSGTLIQDATGGRCWNWDIRLGGDGYPRVLATRYPSSTGARDVPFSDIEYWYYRWTGAAWTGFRIAQNQISLYANENHYAGGLCFDANSIGRIYMSLVVSGKYEISEWSVDEIGQTVTKIRDITSGSSYHNIRPYSPDNYTSTAGVFWCYGSYTTFTDYALGVYSASGQNPVAVQAPVHFSVPTIDDTTPTQGQTLTASHYARGWNSVSYQWKADGANISGATSATYVPVAGDIGKILSVAVTATNSAGSSTSTSASTSAVAAPASDIINDTFTEASTITLASHSPETGGAWSSVANTMQVNSGGYAEGTSSAATGIYINSATPPSADYSVEAVLQRPVANTTFRGHGVLGRWQDANNYYAAFFSDNGTGIELQLHKYVAGVDTNLGQVGASMPADTDTTLKLVFAGSNIKVFWNGVQQISVTDTSHSAAGKVGIRGRQTGKIMSLRAYP